MPFSNMLTEDTAFRYRWVRLVIRMRRPLAAAGIAAAVYGLCRTLVYALGSDGSQDVALTHPFTALSLAWIGIGIFLHRQGQVSPPWKVTISLGFLSLSVAVVLAPLFGSRLFSDPMLGTVAPDTAGILACLFAALVLRRRNATHGLLLLSLGFVLTVNGIVSKSYLVPMFGGHMAYASLMGLVFCLLAITTLFVNGPILRVVFQDDVIGSRTRRLILTSLLVPWLFGALPIIAGAESEAAARLQTFSTAIIIWTFCIMSVHSGFLLETANRAHRSDQRKLEELASRDQLTGLHNRYAIGILMARRLQAFHDGGPRVGVALIDLDHFKTINDTGGHDIGDLVLTTVGRALANYHGNAADAGRWGGEEFIVMFDVRSDNDLRRIPNEILTTIAALKPTSRRTSDNEHRGRVWPVTASIGVACAFDGETDRDQILKRADVALYGAKANGRNRVEYAADFLPIRAA